MKPRNDTNVPPRAREIVTLKPTPDPFLFKVIARGIVQYRRKKQITAQFLAPFAAGAKSVKCIAFTANDGRWHLESLHNE